MKQNKLKLYGIPNCTTVKKARDWLVEHGHDAAFHDFRKQGVDAAWLRKVVAQTGWRALINTRGTTWRKLDDAEKAAVIDEGGAISLMLAHPSVIKRPVLEHGDRYYLGFDDVHYPAILGARLHGQ